MNEKGRHLRHSGFGFYRDLLLLAAGILVVGGIVFGAISLWAGDDGDSDDPTSPPTTDSDATTTSSSSTTTTDPVATTDAPATTAPTTVTSPTTATSATTTPTTIREALAPSQVRVIVLNSTDVAGEAAALTDELALLGYQLAEPTNYTPELSDTMIFHADDFALEAIELSESLPDSTVASDPELAATWGVDVVVVIGRSYVE